MANEETHELGTITLTEQQHELIDGFAEIILDGTFEQAVNAFIIVFDKEPETDLEMMIFKALCEQKIKERSGDYGIKGVFIGGKANE